MKPIGSYKNGNYTVTIFDDGTKVRNNDLDHFEPVKPESIDIKITNRCNMNCPMCHEDSTSCGEHADLSCIPFVDTLLPYTELAIGGGNPLEHPHLIDFLKLCKRKKLIANMTVHQKHFMENIIEIIHLADCGLIHGVGVSATQVDDSFIETLKLYPNTVIHVINGVISMEELRKLYDNDLKVLILGYKDFRRGIQAHSHSTDQRMKAMYDELPKMLNHFFTVSFDNLAIKQLEVKRLMDEEEWKRFYMGDDGQFTMYIDMVNREYAKSSTSCERWPITNDIAEMFQRVRGNA